MEKTLSKGKIVLLLITIYLSTIAIMHDMVIVPAIDGIFGQFYETENMVNYVISGPALVSVLAALVSGKVLQYISKKKWMLVGFAIFAVGAIFGVALENIYYMAAMRSLVGIGMGIVTVTNLAIISEVFTDENKRGSMMGIYNAALSVVASVLGLVAGFFATTSWQSVFKIFLISIPIFIMIVIFIPKTSPQRYEEEEGEKKPLPIKSVLALNVAFLIFTTIYAVVYYKIGIYVSENNIGNEAVVGMLASLGTVGSLVSCLIFGVVYSKLKRGTIIPAYALLTVGFLILILSKNVVSTAIACTLMGGAYGFGISYYNMRCTMIVPPSQIDNSISIVSATLGLGLFMSPFLSTILKGILGVDTLSGILPSLTVVLVIGIVLSIILTIRDKKNPIESQG